MNNQSKEWENMRTMSISQRKMTPSLTQNKLVMLAVVVVVAVALVVAGGAAYIWFSGGSGQGSAPISAPKLDPASVKNGLLFEIDAAQSEARFTVNELLFGAPTTVIGTTQQVAGEILVDPANPANTRMGVMRVNVNTLVTDNEFRNRALRSQILGSNRPEFEFVDFTPKTLTDLPTQVTVGQPITFQVTGDLKVRDVVREVTFSVSLMPVNAKRLEGLAQATIHRQDFGLTIPDVPGVADVTDEVLVEIAFVAVAVSQ